jgi:hypothetical protein
MPLAVSDDEAPSECLTSQQLSDHSERRRPDMIGVSDVDRATSLCILKGETSALTSRCEEEKPRINQLRGTLG